MDVTVDKGFLVLRLPMVPVAKAPTSKSGKTRIVAGTGGFEKVAAGPGIPEGLRVAVNAIVGLQQ